MVRKHRKQRPSSIRSGDGPTAQRKYQKGGVTAEVLDRDASGKALIRRYKAVAECALDIYLANNSITLLEHKAAIRFRCAYLRAVLGVQVEDTAGTHGDPEMAFITPIYSEHLLREAYGALSRIQKSVVISVCGHDECAGTASRVLTLHRALERLADLWKLR